MRDGTLGALVRGTLAGVAGVLAMDLYFRASARVKERFESAADTPDAEDEGDDQRSAGALDDVALIGPYRREDEPATATVGRLAYVGVTGEEPSKEQGARLGTAVHWTYGLAVGGLFGVLRARVHAGSVAAGLGYGAALWLLGDEVAVPLLGLSAGPAAYPPAVHAEALGAHLVYGLTTSLTARMLRTVV